MNQNPRQGTRWERLVSEFRRRTLINVLEIHGWNGSRAANYLGLDKKHLATLLKEYNVTPPRDAPTRKGRLQRVPRPWG